VTEQDRARLANQKSHRILNRQRKLQRISCTPALILFPRFTGPTDARGDMACVEGSVGAGSGSCPVWREDDESHQKNNQSARIFEKD
jgi:hypothetical protein